MRNENICKYFYVIKKYITFTYAAIIIVICSEFIWVAKLLKYVGLEIKVNNRRFTENNSVVIIMDQKRKTLGRPLVSYV